VLTTSKGESGPHFEIRWTPGGSERPWLWLLQTRTAGVWNTEILPSSRSSRAWNGTPPEVAALLAVNRIGRVSTPTVMQVHNGGN
jgi:hypothetical protein